MSNIYSVVSTSEHDWLLDIIDVQQHLRVMQINHTCSKLFLSFLCLISVQIEYILLSYAIALGVWHKPPVFKLLP